MLAVLKATGGPGSIQLLVLSVLLGVGVFIFWPRRRRLAAGWLLAVALSYLFLSVPVVAGQIAGRLPRIPVDVTAPITTLVILDGDNRRGRVREAQRVLATQHPATIWVLGGRWILEALAEAGVPRQTFRTDGRANSTRLQMDQVAKLARQESSGRLAVIASRVQAPRVAALADAQQLSIVVLPAPIDDEPPTSGFWSWIPSYTALRVSRDAIYEHAALTWYRRQGWIRQ